MSKLLFIKKNKHIFFKFLQKTQKKLKQGTYIQNNQKLKQKIKIRKTQPNFTNKPMMKIKIPLLNKNLINSKIQKIKKFQLLNRLINR